MFNNIDRELTINFVMMILGILAALWNVFVFFSAKRAEKSSKESEIKAAEYAEQANEFYKVTAKYYEREVQRQDIELKRIIETEKRELAHDKKIDVLKIINKEGVITTSRGI